jgi:hypothetical protein
MPVVTAKVSNANDDAHERVSNGAMLQQSILNLQANTTLSQAFFGIFRMQLNVPQGATINSATPRLFLFDSNLDNPAGTFHLEAADNAGAVTTTAGDIHNRPVTTASVSWNASDLFPGGTSGMFVDGPDLAAVVQEVVNRPGWESGNYIAVIWIPRVDITSQFACHAYEQSSANAFELVVDYEEDSGPEEKSGSDSGEVASQANLAASLPAADTGELSESAASTTASGAADGASLAETATPAASLQVSDAGILSEAASLQEGMSASGADTGELDESAALLAALFGSDTILLAEAATPAVTAADTGGLDESALSTATLSALDGGTFAESATVTVSLSAADTGSLAEASSLSAEGFFSVSDGGKLSESAVLAVSLEAIDSVTVTDTVSAAAAVSAQDTATLSEIGMGPVVTDVACTLYPRTASLSLNERKTEMTLYKRRTASLSLNERKTEMTLYKRRTEITLEA